MTMKRILGLGLILLGSAAVRPVLAADLWLHLKVDDHAEGSHVDINLPLALLKTALPAIHDSHRASLRFENADVSLPDLRRIWHDLENSPDATFVTVRHDDERVLIAKQGRELVIRTRGREGRDERVEAKIPLRVVEVLLASKGDDLDLAAAVEALAESGTGDLITVEGDHETVRMWVDRTSGSR